MRTLTVNIPNKEYNIRIEKGLLNKIHVEIDRVYKGNKIAIITDANVDALYGDRLREKLSSKYEIKTIVINPGEESKSMEVLMDIYNDLLNFKVTKGDMIVTFGGGVVGDLGGYAAATVLRGIPFIQVPTTLLSQVDSSVGGKVAVNLREGKNLVGAFYQPKAVLIDPLLLDTLNNRTFLDGMGEVIKYGCINNRKLFDDLMDYSNEELKDNIEHVIYECCNEKREIVEQDEKDIGLRMILNFGHTLGHAIEGYYNFSKYTHGEAVAMGMYHITLKSEEMGITEEGTAKRIKEILTKYDLPNTLPDMNMEEIIKMINIDKKSKGDKLNIILLRRIGDCTVKTINQSQIKHFI